MNRGIAASILLLLPTGASAATRVVSGTVLLPNGKPAAGARVWYGRVNGPREHERIEGKADAQGKFRLTVTDRPAQLVVLGGQAGGTAPTLQKLAGAPPKDKSAKPVPVTLKLSAPVALTARVTYSDQKPAIGIPLRVADLSGTPGTAAEPWSYATALVPEEVLRSFAARSDAEGRIRLAGLPPHVGLRWSAGSDVMLSAGSAPYLQLGGPGAQEVGRLIVVRPGSLDVRLLDPAGQPLPGATAHFRPAEPATAGPEGDLARLLHRATADEPVAVDADARGFVHLDGLQPGHYELAFRGKSVPVEIKEGELAGPVVMTGRIGPFTGKVVDADGRPTPGARVTVEIGQPRRAWPPNQAEAVVAGVDGAFSIADFPWEAGQVVVRAVAGTGEAEQVVTLATLKAPITVVLQPNRRAVVKGRALSPNGMPATSAQILLFVPGATGPRPIGLGNTDAAGRFQFDGLRPDATFRVAIAVADQFLQSRPYSAAGAGEQDLGDVRLIPAQPGDPTHRDLRPLQEAFELLAIPLPAELAAAEEFAFRYLEAVRSGEVSRVQSLTSPLSPGYSVDPTAFARVYTPLVPPATGSLTRAQLHALPLVPRFVWGLLLGPDATSEAVRELWPALDRPEWAVIGYRGRVGVNVLLVARKEREGWKAVSGLQFEPAELVTVGGDRDLFGKPYKQPEAAPVLAAAAKYLAAWRAKRWPEMLALTHPDAVEYDPAPAGFTRKWSGSPSSAQVPSTEGAPVLETRFGAWDLIFLHSYPRLVAGLRSGAGVTGPRAGGFPLPEVRAGDVAVVRYGAAAGARRMLLARRGGRWLVVEPALDLKGGDAH